MKETPNFEVEVTVDGKKLFAKKVIQTKGTFGGFQMVVRQRDAGKFDKQDELYFQGFVGSNGEVTFTADFRKATRFKRRTTR
jgi:predicted secreted protein